MQTFSELSNHKWTTIHWWRSF